MFGHNAGPNIWCCSPMAISSSSFIQSGPDLSVWARVDSKSCHHHRSAGSRWWPRMCYRQNLSYSCATGDEFTRRGKCRRWRGWRERPDRLGKAAHGAVCVLTSCCRRWRRSVPKWPGICCSTHKQTSHAPKRRWSRMSCTNTRF